MSNLKKISVKHRILFTLLVTVLIWINLIWDHFHKGVPSHHILHRQDYPEISNWWGGIAVPLLTWILLLQTAKRVDHHNVTDTNSFNKVRYGFFGALLFGILLSVLFTLGSNLPGFMMIGVLLLSFFIPLYRAEFLLGFVLGMTYTFGGILPIGVGILLTIICVINYRLIRKGVLYLLSMVRSEKSKIKEP